MVKGEGLIDIVRHLPRVPGDMISLIAAFADCRADLTRVEQDMPADIPLSDVHLAAPIPRPGKILAIGLNYADHVAETGREAPKHQMWFCKHQTSVNGPFDPIEVPLASQAIDYEAEMVFVIGKRGRHFPVETAKDAVFGYCVGNDVSVRDWQMRTPQFMLGKSFDTHAPFGPWITTADEVGDPHSLAIRCLLNGEVMQESSTKHMIFSVGEQIAHLSEAMTLEPGDIAFTGTPGGVGAAKRPPLWLKAGDRVRVEIDRLGAIEGVMRREGEV